MLRCGTPNKTAVDAGPWVAAPFARWLRCPCIFIFKLFKYIYYIYTHICTSILPFIVDNFFSAEKQSSIIYYISQNTVDISQTVSFLPTTIKNRKLSRIIDFFPKVNYLLDALRKFQKMPLKKQIQTSKHMYTICFYETCVRKLLKC